MEIDSLLTTAHEAHDYEQILELADHYEAAEVLSKLKACYWRGYAYSGMRKMRQAEKEWKEAVTQDVISAGDLEYYSKSANRLAGLLYMKFDYEGTIRVAVPAMTLLEEKQYTDNGTGEIRDVSVRICQFLVTGVCLLIAGGCFTDIA